MTRDQSSHENWLAIIRWCEIVELSNCPISAHRVTVIFVLSILASPAKRANEGLMLNFAGL